MRIIGALIAVTLSVFCMFAYAQNSQLPVQPPGVGPVSSITGLGTGVATALGVAVNTAGGAITSPAAVANGGTGDTGTAWVTYTPTVACSSGTVTTDTAAGRYKTIGKTVFLQIGVIISSIGTCSGGFTATLPANANSVGLIYPLSGYNGSVGTSFPAVADSGIAIFTVSLPTTNSYYVGGTYESN